MLDNAITIAVDEGNTGVTADQTFSRYEEYLNRSVYVAGDHSLVSPHTLSFYRTQPKANGSFRGMAKSAFKFSESISVAGVDSSITLEAPLIAEMSFSIPVGATAAQVVEMRQRIVALLDGDILMNKLNLQLEV